MVSSSFHHNDVLLDLNCSTFREGADCLVDAVDREGSSERRTPRQGKWSLAECAVLRRRRESWPDVPGSNIPDPPIPGIPGAGSPHERFDNNVSRSDNLIRRVFQSLSRTVRLGERSKDLPHELLSGRKRFHHNLTGLGDQKGFVAHAFAIFQGLFITEKS